MLKQDLNLTDFKLGIDMMSDETSLPRGAARDAVNVDFDVYGNFHSRDGFTKLGSLTDAHSLFGARDQSFGLYMQGSNLKRMVVADDGTPLSATIMSGLTPSDRMSFFEHADEVFFTNGHELGVVTRTGCRLLGVPDPAALSVIPVAAVGTIQPGLYSLACSYLLASGEESGLSPMVNVTLDTQGGFSVYLPTPPAGVVKARIYCTPTNGDVLYQVAELTTFGMQQLLELQPTKTADNQFLHRTPAGSIVRAWHGRLLVAVGNTVVFSQPFRYGLTDPRSDFINFNTEVVMIEPVDGGVYVGTNEAVYFLAGTGPGDFTQALACTNAPTPYASTLVHGAVLPPKIAQGVDGLVALWLGRLGYSLGLPSGLVHDVQSDRIALPIYDSGSLVAYSKDGVKQVLSIVESTRSAGLGSAVDSNV
jgi:hypothetical protein